MVAEKVTVIVAEEMQSKFGIIIDGWSQGSAHYIALFTSYAQEGKQVNRLLSISPPTDKEGLDADSHYQFIEETLALFSKNISNLLYLVGDNPSVNSALARKLQVPFVGCASHRFNLEVQ